MKNFSKIFAAILILGIFALGAYVVAQTTTPAETNLPPVSVTAEQLKSAGFTDVTVQPATNSAFLLPNHYFRVKEAVPANLGWGDASNLVAVLVTPKVNKNWTYNNGQPETIELSGKSQVRFTTADYYVVVTGPDSAKVRALADELKTL